MCSNARPQGATAADTAAAVAETVDTLAAAITAGEDATGPEFAAQLADAWAMIAAADPELAARTARYSRS
jgi:hypothetical protein